MAGSSHVVRALPLVFTAGYSQGGHAAFAAADLRGSYAPEVPLAGAIGFGSTNDVEALLREGTCYAPLIFYTYQVLYGIQDIDPGAYLLDRWARTLEADVTSMCVDQFQKYYGFDAVKVYRPEFREALYGGTLAERYPGLAARLAENRSGLDGHGLPALVVQGGADFIVTTADADALRRCAARCRESCRLPGVPRCPAQGDPAGGFSRICRLDGDHRASGRAAF